MKEVTREKVAKAFESSSAKEILEIVGMMIEFNDYSNKEIRTEIERCESLEKNEENVQRLNALYATACCHGDYCNDGWFFDDDDAREEMRNKITNEIIRDGVADAEPPMEYAVYIIMQDIVNKN